MSKNRFCGLKYRRLLSQCGFILAALTTVTTTTAFAACPSNTPTPGCMRYALYGNPNFDAYTDAPSPSLLQWEQQHWWRIRSYSPYFDTRLSWWPDTIVYEDAYGIHTNQSLPSEHPDWFLKDSNGNLLYIPFSCSNGTCSQYAADFSNTSFQNWWISNTQSQMNAGYIGLWIDDVNLQMDVSDGWGNSVTPIDVHTGQPMTKANWETYMANYLTLIRTSFPTAQITHNAVWFAGSLPSGTDPNIQKEILAADQINLERAFSDTGLTGGTGQWSMNAFMSYIDIVHSLGRPITLQPYDFNGDLDLAGYFLMWSPGDGFSNDACTPDNWPVAYDVQLGSPLGARYSWQGLYRRDYSNGVVLVNPPQAPTVTVTPNGSFTNDNGQPVTSVTLAASQGSVLVGTPYSAPTPVQINTGGGSVGAFGPDEDFSGGTVSSFTHSVDLSNVNNPPPMAVYQDRRVGSKGGSGFTYTIPSLVPGHAYTVRFHFADPYASGPGQRVFNVAVNGYTLMQNYDIYASTGGQYIAGTTQYTVKPNSQNQMYIEFQQGPSSLGPMVSAIEILP